jgi:hypothetical protein
VVYNSWVHTYIFSALSAFFTAHIYRDYLHLKGVKNTLFTRIGHFWDAPQYEKHGMVVCAVLATTCFIFAIT